MTAEEGDETMDHPRIDDEKIVDRYLVGKLSPEDEAAFEEHLFDCRQCLEAVESGEDLRRGLREVAAEDAATLVQAKVAQATLVQAAAVQVGILAWLRRQPRSALLVAGLALAALLLPALLLQRQAQLRDELARLRSAAAGPDQPTADFQLASLGAVRGEEPAEIRLEPGGKPLLLSLELPPTAPNEATRFRATLRRAGTEPGEAGAILWQGENLTPTVYDTLLVLLPADWLEPGSYQITMEGAEGTSPETASEMNFHLSAP